jgi:hypothetical protein
VRVGSSLDTSELGGDGIMQIDPAQVARLLVLVRARLAAEARVAPS